MADYIINGGDKAEFLRKFKNAMSDGFDPDKVRETLNPKPETLKPQTPNPKPQTLLVYVCECVRERERERE